MPTSLNNDLLNDNVIFETYNKVINVALKTSFRVPFTQTQAPRTLFLKAQRLILMVCTDGWVRRPVREMQGGDLGGRPDLLPENEDDG